MLLDQVRESSADLHGMIRDLEQEPSVDRQRSMLRSVGARWHDLGGEPEVLAELGFAITQHVKMEPGIVLADLMMAYGAAREDKRFNEWEQTLVRRISELHGLHRVISAANSTLDIDTSMQTVVETVAEVMSVEACSVYLYDKNTDDLTLRATRGLNPAAVGRVRIPMGVGVTGNAARDGKPLAVADAWADPRFNREPALGEEGFRTLLAVPIVLFSAERFHIGSDKLQGVLAIQTSGPREFTPEEIRFAETVSGELAFFIVNAQLYQQTDEQLHQKVRELTTLQQVSKRIAEQLDFDEVLRLIATKSVELAHVDRVDIFRYDENEHLVLATSHGGSSSRGVHNFIAMAVRESRPLAVVNAYNDTRFPELAHVAAQEQFMSLFCMPLHTRGRVIGAICLYTRELRHFDYEQVRLLSTFADEAAIVMENARLYGESQRALRIKSAMLQEMHHRVRNNMQTISALLTMQLRRMDQSDNGAEALRDSVARIQAIAGVHNLLCQEDMGVTTVDAVAKQIVESARVSLVDPNRPISFAVQGESANVGSREATVLAIVLNELVSNALSHGLAQVGGEVVVESGQDDEMICVEVRDNGPSRPKPEHVLPTKSSGLGLQIIRTLVSSDLEGTFELVERNGWMHAQVRFPKWVSKEPVLKSE